MTDDEVVAYLSSDREPGGPPDDSTRLQQTRSFLADPASWAEPAPDLERRVLEAVANASTRPATEPVSLATERERRTPGRGPRRWRTALVAAAAAVVLAVGVGAVVNSVRTRPAQFTATVTGTELAPGVAGSVTMTKTTSGWRIHLQVKGLPRLDGGRFYEAWLKDSAGTLVPIGTFNQADDVTLWSGVSPADFPSITVTQQSADAGPASSGRKVLTGTGHRTH